MTGPSALPDLSGPAYALDQPRRAFVEQVMGLPVSVHVRGPYARAPEVERAAESMFAAGNPDIFPRTCDGKAVESDDGGVDDGGVDGADAGR